MSKEFTVPLSLSSFLVPHYFCQSAWIEHAPFAFWLTDAVRPKRFVELGSHHGYSYFVFCQAIQHLGISTAAYAVDTWQGDEHAGFYDNSVYEAVLAINQRYAGFSRLNRATFAEAAPYFADKSIDLIHIDGRHFYDDVKEDFESWLPKLTEDAIVLFHDTNVRERGFGVWKFFEELSARYPTFQFIHGNGLGMLALGKIPDNLGPLFDATDSQVDQIRSVYSSLGGLLVPRRQLMAKTEAIDELLKDGADVSVNAAERFARISDWDGQVQQIRAALEHCRAIELATDPARLHAADIRIVDLEGTLALLNEELNQLKVVREKEEAEAHELHQSIESLHADLDVSNEKVARLERGPSDRNAELAALCSTIGLDTRTEKGSDAKNLRSLLAEMVIEERRHIQELSRENAEKYHQLLSELTAIQTSTTWRMMSPIRRMLAGLPVLRTPARRAVKAIYWTATGQFFKRLAARREALKQLHAQGMPAIDVEQADEEITPAGTSVPPEAARSIQIDYSVAVPFSFAGLANLDHGRTAVIMHLYYEELAGEFRSYLNNIPGAVDIYISTSDSFRASVIESAFSGWTKGSVEVRVVPNRGRDIAPKLVSFGDVYERYEYILHLHGKRSKHADVLAPWRHFLLENLLGTPEVVTSILYAFDRNPRLGIVAAQHFEPMRHWANWGGNFGIAERLAKRIGFELSALDPLDFPSGSMFWARSAALKPLLDLDLKTEDFDEECNQKDATLAHAIERLYFHSCEHAGFDWIKVARPELYEHTPAIIGVSHDSDLEIFFKHHLFRVLDPGGVKPRVIMPDPVAKPAPKLLEYVQSRALGLHVDVRPETRVAIGLVTYNNPLEELTAALSAAEFALESCSLSTRGSLFLIDNGQSSEGLLPDASFITRQPSRGNVGFGRGHNQLMRAAFESGYEIYIAINPDGLMHPESVRALVQMVEASDGKALVEALQFPSEHPKPYDTNTFDTPWVSGACLAISRAAYDDLGGFDENFFMYCEDVDLSWRARAHGYALKTCPRALFLHAVTNREMKPATLRMIFESGIILARKWGATEFEKWLRNELTARSLAVPSVSPMIVPEEWRKIADFSNHFSFAQPRW